MEIKPGQKWILKEHADISHLIILDEPSGERDHWTIILHYKSGNSRKGVVGRSGLLDEWRLDETDEVKKIMSQYE